MVTFNQRAFFRIEQGRILARYHWLGKMDCDLEEVAFAQSRDMTLNILLSNGKRHVIGFLSNASELCDEIRRKNFTMEQAAPEFLREQLEQIHQKRCRRIYWTIGGCALLFVNIALTVLLTGGREIYAFSPRDWWFFSFMGGVEFGTLVATFAMAQRCGRWMIDMQYLRHRLQKSSIAAQLLPSGQVKAVYTDVDLNGRLTVCGLPNDRSLFYIVQEFNDDFHLDTVETSSFFEDQAALMEDLAPNLLDITSWFVGEG